MKKITSILFVLTGLLSFSQVSVEFTTWKNDANSTFTITHDDYGDIGAHGIEDYADTIAYNSGIPFTFGAIIKHCDDADWLKAKQMVEQHGHELMNHSWNHICGRASAGAWCQAHGVWTAADFDVELLGSTNVITQKTGYRPRFFIYPFDQFVSSMNEYLIDTLNYLGTRTGPYDQGNNDANISTPEYPGFYITKPTTDISDITSSLDDVVQAGGWGMREFHGVNDPSWGVVSETDYRTFINAMKTYVDNNELWAATVSQVISYIKQRQIYTPSASFTNQIISVDFSNSNNFNMDEYLGARTYTSPVTVRVDASNHPNNYTITQNGVEITDYIKNGNIYLINIYPDKGSITMSDGCLLCITEQPKDTLISIGEDITLSITANSPNPITYQWYKNGTIITGETNNTITITNAVSSNSGNYTVTLTTSEQTATSSTATLIVNSCPQSICVLSASSGTTTITEGESVNFSVVAEGVNLFYQWYKDGQAVVGATNASLNFTSASFINKGAYYVKISNNGYSIDTSNITLIVNESPSQMAYPNGVRHSIGIGTTTIEAEDFDIGGEGIAYHDATPGREVDNTYRNDTDVEIETGEWSGVSVGYTQAGEWLEYSINILNNGGYNIFINNASDNTNGLISIYIDETLVIPSTSLPNTFGWATFQSTDLGLVTLTSGMHIIRMFISGNNIDKLEFVSQPITASDDTADKFTIELVPNPTAGQLVINSHNGEQLEVIITNSLGKVIINTSTNGSDIIDGFENLPTGMYFVNIKGNNINLVEKVIKQ